MRVLKDFFIFVYFELCLRDSTPSEFNFGFCISYLCAGVALILRDLVTSTPLVSSPFSL